MSVPARNGTKDGYVGDRSLRAAIVRCNQPVAASLSSPLPKTIRRADDPLHVLLRRLRHLLAVDSVIAVQYENQRFLAIVGVTGDEQDPQFLKRCIDQHRGASEASKSGSPSLRDSQDSWIVVAPDPITDACALLLKASLGVASSINILAVRNAPYTGFADVCCRAAQQVAPWVRDYLELWAQLHQESKRSAGLQGSLDQVGLAIVRLDGDAHVIGYNAAARELLIRNDGLILVSEHLSATEREDDVKLQTAMRHAIICGKPGANAPVLAIRRKSGPSLIVTVLRVPPGRRRGDTAIVLQIVRSDIERSAALTAVCTIFGLSGAETRLAILLATGVSLADAAIALRVQLPTARGYLRQLFDKTGTNRQAALVHLLMSSLMHPATGIDLRVL